MSKSYSKIEDQNDFLGKIHSHYNRESLKNSEIISYVNNNNLPFPHFIFRDKSRKMKRGLYNVAMAATITKLNPMPKLPKMKPVAKKAATIESVEPEMSNEVKYSSVEVMRNDISATVPETDPTYVPFGNYVDVEKIIKSKIFFPVYITGLSGNGKTMSIMQACAKLKRKLLRINVTEETDELDLIGGTELVNGSTVYREGAVILAMREGAVLLIDEGDLNNTKILCLMPILEGKPYLNKKTGEIIKPAEGFNIFITGNTKGQGSEDGRFVGTKVMNEAFLERFAITMEQEYPTMAVEKKIIIKNMEKEDCLDEDFASRLAEWSENIRKTFKEEACNNLITTRRLTHIVKAYSIFRDRLKCINLALNRFDDETKIGFLDLYTKIDESVNPKPEPVVAAEVPAPTVTVTGSNSSSATATAIIGTDPNDLTTYGKVTGFTITNPTPVLSPIGTTGYIHPATINTTNNIDELMPDDVHIEYEHSANVITVKSFGQTTIIPKEQLEDANLTPESLTLEALKKHKANSTKI